MKRALIVVFALLFLLCACDGEKGAPTLEAVSEAVLSPLENQAAFTLVDEDFEENNFDFSRQTERSRIYIDENREVGIFKLKSEGDRTLVENGIRDYIATEQESIASLLMLYPDETLSEKLSNYQSASVLEKNGYICYFILPKHELAAAKQAFLQLF